MLIKQKHQNQVQEETKRTLFHLRFYYNGAVALLDTQIIQNKVR